MKVQTLWCACFFIFGSLCANANATPGTPPKPVEPQHAWRDTDDLFNDELARARTKLDQAQNNTDKSKWEEFETNKKAIDSALKTASQALNLANQALAMYQTLSKNDKGLDPDYKPPGTPDIPSQCMEDAKCAKCYGRAQESVTSARVGLEKARRISDFTHKLAAQGEALMQGVGSMAGGHAALQASVEVIKTEQSLRDFDKVVAKKNQELLARLENGLREIGTCEEQFYKNDDWYNRYGFMYHQFMLKQYSQ